MPAVELWHRENSGFLLHSLLRAGGPDPKVSYGCAPNSTCPTMCSTEVIIKYSGYNTCAFIIGRWECDWFISATTLHQTTQIRDTVDHCMVTWRSCHTPYPLSDTLYRPAALVVAPQTFPGEGILLLITQVIGLVQELAHLGGRHPLHLLNDALVDGGAQGPDA